MENKSIEATKQATEREVDSATDKLNKSPHLGTILILVGVLALLLLNPGVATKIGEKMEFAAPWSSPAALGVGASTDEPSRSWSISPRSNYWFGRVDGYLTIKPASGASEIIYKSDEVKSTTCEEATKTTCFNPETSSLVVCDSKINDGECTKVHSANPEREELGLPYDSMSSWDSPKVEGDPRPRLSDIF